MLVSRTWRRRVSRPLSQKSRFFAQFSISPHRDGFFAGRSVGSSCTGLRNQLHEFTLSTPLLKGGFLAGKGLGLDPVMPVCAQLGSADNSRCFCTSEACTVEGYVNPLDLQPDEDIATWEEQIKPYVRKCTAFQRDIPLLRQDFASVRESAYASAAECNLHLNGAVAGGIDDPLFLHKNDMGAYATRNKNMRGAGTRTDRNAQSTASVDGEDLQEPSLSEYGDVAERLPFETQEATPVFPLESDDKDVLSPEDGRIVNAICKLLKWKGWTASTKEILEKEYSVHLPHSVISAVILQQKNVALASSFFEWACKHIGHYIVIYHAYLVNLGATNHFDEMRDVLSKMKENGLDVNGETFCIILRACRVARAPAMAVDAFKRAHEYGVVLGVHMHRALLMVLFESNLLVEAKLYYSYMVQEGLPFDTHMYNTLIDGFNQFSAAEDATNSFDTMLKEGWEPNILTYNGLIEAYCSMHAIEKAISAFSDLQLKGLKPTASTVNLLLSAFLKMGRLDDAISFFATANAVCNLNRSTFNILLNGLFLCKQHSKAISLFASMEKEGLANRLTYIYLASGLRGSKQTKGARQLLKTLFDRYGYDIREVCIALLDNLCRSGDVTEAENLFNGMIESSEEPYVPSFAMMISLYSRLGMLDRAFMLLSVLKDNGWRPTVFCYHPIIVALLKAGRTADALKYFQELPEQKHEINALLDDYLLRELCKHGMAEDALSIVNTIVSNKACIVKSTIMELMKCLCKVGKIEEANTCFRALYKERCLLLPKEAAQQAFSVMDVMSYSSKEEDRVSTCASL